MVKVLVDFEFLEALFLSTKSLLNEGNPVGLKVIHLKSFQNNQKTNKCNKFLLPSNYLILRFRSSSWDAWVELFPANKPMQQMKKKRKESWLCIVSAGSAG